MSGFLDKVAAERWRLAEEVAARSTPEAVAAQEAAAAEVARRAAAPARLAGIVREFAAEMDRLGAPATHYFAVDQIPHPLRTRELRQGVAAHFAEDLGGGWAIGVGRTRYEFLGEQRYSKWIVLRDGRVVVRESHHDEPHGDFRQPPTRPLFNTVGARNRIGRIKNPLFDAPRWVFEEVAFGLDRVLFSDGINGMLDDAKPASTLEDKMTETLALY